MLAADAKAPQGCPVSLIDETTTVYMLLGSGDVDHAKQLEKHLKEQVCTPECIGPEIELQNGHPHRMACTALLFALIRINHMQRSGSL